MLNRGTLNLERRNNFSRYLLNDPRQEHSGPIEGSQTEACDPTRSGDAFSRRETITGEMRPEDEQLENNTRKEKCLQLVKTMAEIQYCVLKACFNVLAFSASLFCPLFEATEEKKPVIFLMHLFKFTAIECF